jgi:phosphoglycolate phosphatase
VDAIAVTYGAHPENALRAAKALICVNNVEELASWLAQNSVIPQKESM